MSPPLISIIIPARDRVQELKNTLDSIFQQDEQNFEILVCENNSIDKDYFYDSLMSYDDFRLKIITVENCKNANVARNFGASISNGKYLAFMDSDDLWSKEHLSVNISIMENSTAEFIYGGAVVFDGDVYRSVSSRGIRTNESPADYMLGWDRGYAQTSSYFLTKEGFDKIRWNDNLHRNQDLDFFVRAASLLKTRYSEAITTTIIWEKGVKRNFCIESMLYFYKSNVNNMRISTAIRYLLILIKLSAINQRLAGVPPFFVVFMKRIYRNIIGIKV
jgi:glycosyltransferase involved in cell wall biosynthesis